MINTISNLQGNTVKSVSAEALLYQDANYKVHLPNHVNQEEPRNAYL